MSVAPSVKPETPALRLKPKTLKLLAVTVLPPYSETSRPLAALLPEMSVLFRVTVAYDWLKRPPPLAAELRVIVLLVIVAGKPLKRTPPPSSPALFPEMVLFVTVTSEPPTPPAKPGVELPEMVLLDILREPPKMPPPPVMARLPEMVLLVIVTAPKLNTPPPPVLLPFAEFPEIVLFLRIRTLSSKRFMIPPPSASPPVVKLPDTVVPGQGQLTFIVEQAAAFLAIPRNLSPVIFVRCTARFPPVSIAKMRKFGAVPARLIVAPLPLMVMALVITGRPLGPKSNPPTGSLLSTAVSVCVLPAGNTIVSAPLPAVHLPVAVSVFAAVIALTRLHPALTLIVAAIAGV